MLVSLSMCLPVFVLDIALGSTAKAAGSSSAFHAIDHGLVLSLCEAAHAHGVQHVSLVSSLGANVHASNQYLRTKGQVTARSHAICPCHVMSCATGAAIMMDFCMCAAVGCCCFVLARTFDAMCSLSPHVYIRASLLDRRRYQGLALRSVQHLSSVHTR